MLATSILLRCGEPRLPPARKVPSGIQNPKRSRWLILDAPLAASAAHAVAAFLADELGPDFAAAASAAAFVHLAESYTAFT
jgi:hypothetical protein